MRMRAFVCSVLLSVLFCSLAFSSISAKAIDQADLLQLTAQQYSAMIGNSVNGYYLAIDNTYKPITFSYWGPSNISSIDADGFSVDSFTSVPVCWYTAPYPNDYRYVNTPDPQWIVDWNLHFGNVFYFKSLTACIFNNSLYSTYTTNPLSAFSPYYDICVGDVQSDIISLGSRSTLSGYGAQLTMQNSVVCSVIPFEVERASGTDLYIGSGNYCLVSLDSNVCWIGFACPQINSGYTFIGHSEPPIAPVVTTSPNYTGDTAVITGTIASNGDVNITVEQDNSGLIGGILSGIRNLFVPSSEYLDSFTADLQDEWSEHLGGVSEAVDLIDDWKLYFQNAVARDPPSITFPELTIPLSDGDNTSDYTIIQSQQVELKPYNTQNGLKVLWDAVAFAIDVVCVLAVLNMLQTKYEIFLNPDGEVIDYDN